MTEWTEHATLSPSDWGKWVPLEHLEVMVVISDPVGMIRVRERKKPLTTTNPKISELSSRITDTKVRLRELGAALGALSTTTAELRQELVEVQELLFALDAELKATQSE